MNKGLLILGAVGVVLYMKSKAAAGNSAHTAAPKAQSTTAQIESAATNAAGTAVTDLVDALGIQKD